MIKRWSCFYCRPRESFPSGTGTSRAEAQRRFRPGHRGGPESMGISIRRLDPQMAADGRRSPQMGKRNDRGRIGRTPAEIAEGAEIAEDYWSWGLQIHRSCYLQLFWSAESRFPQNPAPKVGIRALTQPIPWAGGKRHRVLCALSGRLSKSGWRGQVGKLPFRTASGWRLSNRPLTVGSHRKRTRGDATHE
jgi:hypothetical protein